MQIKSILLTLIISGLALAQSENLEILNLDELINEGLANNPTRKAYSEDINAAASRVIQSSTLPDPMLSVNLMNLPFENFGFDQEPMSGKQLGFKQGIPFPGKLNLKSKVAEVGVEISREQYAEVSNSLVRDISNTYHNLYFIDEAIKTIEKNRQLVNELQKVAQQKYAVGKGLQQDVLKAQVELSLMMERLISLKQKRERIESTLNMLLNRPIDQVVGVTHKPKIRSLHLSFEELKQLGEENRPLLKLWRKRIERTDRKIDLARKNLLPDFAVSAAYTQRDVLATGMGGADFFSTGISLNLPIYAKNKQKQQIQEERIVHKSVLERQESIQQQVNKQINDALTELDENIELLELYRTGIVPQAAQALESALTGYQTDKVDFLTLISSQMTLFNLELEYARLISTNNKNVADLEFAIGISLPATD